MTTVTILVGAILFNLLIILLVKADLSAFARAAILADEQGRLDEFKTLPGKLAPGSGFRLLKHFKKPATNDTDESCL